MRRTAAGMLAMLCLPVPSGFASPLDAPVELVVTANGPATTTLRLKSPLTLNLSGASITTKGKYAGLAIFRGRDDYRGAVVAVPAIDSIPQTRAIVAEPNFTPGPTSLTLSAGTYQLHVLGDASTEVRVPTNGSADITLVAKGVSRQRATIATGSLAANEATANLRKRVQPLAHSWVAVVGKYQPTVVTTTVRLTTCLAVAGRACGRGNRIDSQVAQDFGMVRAGFPSTPGSQRMDALVTVTADPGIGGSLALAYLQLDL